MRNLKTYAYVVELTWISKKWSSHWIIDRKGIGRYVICETKRKAMEIIKIAKSCGQKARLVKWRRMGVVK